MLETSRRHHRGWLAVPYSIATRAGHRLHESHEPERGTIFASQAVTRWGAARHSSWERGVDRRRGGPADSPRPHGAGQDIGTEFPETVL